jgi:transcriptional regulator with XRE-family HTH domain
MTQGEKIHSPVNEQAALKDLKYVSGLIGKRITAFRHIMDLKRQQLAKELDITENLLESHERGKVGIDAHMIFAEKFYNLYGVNANWLISGSGAMFIKKGPLTPPGIYNLYKSTALEPKYEELITIMKHLPVIEQLVLARFEEAKIICSEDIKALTKKKSKSKA